MKEALRLPVVHAGKEISHLQVQLCAPPQKTPLCLVYLHGFGSDQTGEKTIFFREEALAAGLAYCSFDFQGHGASGGTMRALTISRNLSDMALVHEWLKERDHAHLGLIGSSMGGLTALWYAALHPDGIAAGLHIAPALGMEEGLVKSVGEERARRWEAEGVTQFKSDFVSTELGWEFVSDARNLEVTRLLKIYRTPTLILQSKRDESVSWRNVQNFATRCEYEGIDLHLFADGDHRLTDRKDRLWALMMEFLRGRKIL